MTYDPVMIGAFSRSELLLGREAMLKLASARVAVFGLGGVGSYAVEALARTGVGAFVLVDHDHVAITNINRQIIALRSTIGRSKVSVSRERILDINPDASVEDIEEFYGPENAPRLLRGNLSYVVDAIDTVSSKLDLIVRCAGMGIPIVSSMGAGNKLDPTRLELADIYETSVCPLARVMRRELKKRGVPALPVVYSKEEPAKPDQDAEMEPCPPGRHGVPGSIAFVPSVAGLIIASKVVADLCRC